MPPGTKVADKNDSDDISDLIGGSDEAWEGAGDLEPLLDCCNNWVDVARTQSLLESHQEGQK